MVDSHTLIALQALILILQSPMETINIHTESDHEIEINGAVAQLEAQAGIVEVVPPPSTGATIQDYRRVRIALTLSIFSNLYLSHTNIGLYRSGANHSQDARSSPSGSNTLC